MKLPLRTAHLLIPTAITRATALEQSMSDSPILSRWMTIFQCARCLGVLGSRSLLAVRTSLSLFSTVCLSLVAHANAHYMVYVVVNLQDAAPGATPYST